MNRINSALAFFMSGRLDFLVAFRPVVAAPALLVAPVVWSFLARVNAHINLRIAHHERFGEECHLSALRSDIFLFHIVCFY